MWTAWTVNESSYSLYGKYSLEQFCCRQFSTSTLSPGHGNERHCRVLFLCLTSHRPRMQADQSDHSVHRHSALLSSTAINPSSQMKHVVSTCNEQAIWCKVRTCNEHMFWCRVGTCNEQAIWCKVGTCNEQVFWC